MEKKIAIPDGIEVSIEKDFVTARNDKNEITKKLYYPKATFEKKGNDIIIKTKDEKRKTLSIINTWSSLVKNMFEGVTKGYRYKMKIHHVHFPMNVSVEGNKLVIKNYLGQKEERTAKIIEGIKVQVNNEEIIIEGIDKEKVGQTAANIEKTTSLRTRRDRRIFSDGVYIISRGDDDGKK